MPLLTPAENVALWPRTLAIASSSEAGPFAASKLNDGTPEAWGSTSEPGHDIYAALVLQSPQPIQEYRIQLFSPEQPPRPHLRDIRVIVADSEDGGQPQWQVLRSRLSPSQPFSAKVTVPPGSDGSVVRVEIDRSDPNWGPHKIWGFGCFTSTYGDVRNYLPPGTGMGVYVRELEMSTGRSVSLPKANATLSNAFLDFLVTYGNLLLVLLVAAVLLLLPLAVPASGSGLERSYTFHAVLVLLTGILTLGLLAVTFRAFSTDRPLHWDETYYANIAVMGAHGRGLYQSIQNMMPTHIAGGVGYLAYLFVIAVKLFGATIYPLRFVSVVAMMFSLLPIYLILKIWYDSLTGFFGIALAPCMNLFRLSNTARMDSITMAIAAWIVFLVALAFRKQDWRWHLAAGMLAGFALQAHIDTLAVTIGCGLLYLVNARLFTSHPRTWMSRRSPIVAFTLGFGIMAGAYVVANILPDVHGYFRAVSYARPAVVHNGTESLKGLVQSVLSTRALSKEVERYRSLFDMAPFEGLIFVLGCAALLTRRLPGDRQVLVLLLGAAVGAGLVLYNPSPYYAIHLFPILVLPLAPLFTRGFRKRDAVTSGRIGVAPVLALIVVMAVVIQEPLVAVAAAPRLFPHSTSAPEIVGRVKRIASAECSLAGDREMYVPYFMDYPLFYSTVKTEEDLGVLYRGGGSVTELWQTLKPDVVFGSVDERIAPYLQQAHYQPLGPNIWLKTETGLTRGCVIARPVQ